MAEFAVTSPYMKLQFQRLCIEEITSLPKHTHFRRKHWTRSCKIIQPISWKMPKLSALGASNFTSSPCLRGCSLKCCCLGSSMINSNIVTVSDWVPIVDQALLMASVFLAYMAGVIPTKKSNFNSPSNILDDNVGPDASTFSGSATKHGDLVNSKNAWDIVKRKLLDSLNVIANGGDIAGRVIGNEEQSGKRPLSLYALADGPRLRLLLACFQHLQEEVNNISVNSETVDRKEWIDIFSKIMQSFCQPVCTTWLEKEIYLENNEPDKAILSLMFEKLKGDDTILQNISKAGKEDLFADLLCFLRFSSLREGLRYGHGLFALHGVAILEDLVITLADGITSIYLELISVDSNMSTEMNGMGPILCTLSTRALQRLRNEVALNQWLLQNMETVVSMYEDRFDLWTLQRQLTDEPIKSRTERLGWWKKLMLRKSESASLPSCYFVIGNFSMPVKRTKELRALTGWRYYFSLLLELSDIGMPLVRVVFAKVSSAISFFLVCLIGRSLGLIYTGIRQSLQWK